MLLALAEIRRARGRFTMLVGSVALLVVLLLFFQAVGGALSGGLSGAFTAAGADVWVYDASARRNPQASVLAQGTADAVASVTDVERASATTFTTLEVDGEPIAIVATDPGSPALPSTVDSGRTTRSPREAVAGTSTFVGVTPEGRVVLPGDVTVDVVGEATGATFNVLPTLFLDRDSAARAVSADVGRDLVLPTSAIAVEVADTADPAVVADTITREVDGVEAVTASVAVDSLPGAGTVTRSFSILYLLLYVVAAIVTAVFFQILTVQKRDALVLLRAVGATPSDLSRTVLLQVVLVVGAAVVAGSVVALVLLAGTQDVFGAGLSGGTIVRSAGLLLVLGVVAGLLSVRRILAIEPVEAVEGGGLR